mgnify:CR=1 FL=1
MTIAELLTASRQRLADVSDSASLDSELLLCHCLNKNRTYLRAWSDKVVAADVLARFEGLLARRAGGEPVAYIMGERGFWTLDLQVSPATLIPRPETELLVETVLSLLADRDTAKVIDLGTGTGAIALALASERPNWQLLGCDVQAEAIALAERNRQRYQLANIELVHSSWFSAIEPQRFDAIVSNPPYIDAADPHLHQGDVRFEPRSALVADKQGMADIEHIACASLSFLAPGGYLLFEHGYQQALAVQACLAAEGFVEINTLQDLSGLDRVTLGRAPE